MSDLSAKLRAHFERPNADTKEAFAERAGVGVATVYRALAGDGLQVRTAEKLLAALRSTRRRAPPATSTAAA